MRKDTEQNFVSPPPPCCHCLTFFSHRTRHVLYRLVQDKRALNRHGSCPRTLKGVTCRRRRRFIFLKFQQAQLDPVGGTVGRQISIQYERELSNDSYCSAVALTSHLLQSKVCDMREGRPPETTFEEFQG